MRRLLALFRRPERHRHQWTYTGPHGTGWLIARCECGAWDLAS